jgi:hypothetical protein
MAGRRPLLEFLRNLTSQTLFAALAGFVVYRLSATRALAWDPALPLSLLVFGGVFVLAFAANASVFFEELFKEYMGWRRRAVRHVRRSVPSGSANSAALVKLHWHLRRREPLLAALWILLLLFIFVAVLLAAIFAAKGYVSQIAK